MPHELRGYIGSIGAILWSLNGTIRVMGWFQYHMRGYKVSRLSVCYSIWPLSGNIRTRGGLQTSVLHAIQLSLGGTRGSRGGIQ